MFQRFCLTVFCGLLALSACRSKESPAQTRAPSAALFEAAKKRAKWFSTRRSISATLARCCSASSSDYPFIKTELLRLSAEPLLNRIFTEDRAGRNVVDVINNTMINPLKKARLLQPYRSPEHAAYLDPFKDSEGYWASVNNNYYVVGCNSRLVSAKDAPTDWQDLLNPKWKGKDRHGSGRIRMVRRNPGCLGTGAGAQISSRPRAAGSSMAQGPHLDLAADRGGRISDRHRLRASDRVDEEGRRAGRMGQDQQSDFRRALADRSRRESASSQRWKAVARFYAPTNRSSSCAAPIVCRAGPISSLWCLRCTIVN